MMKYLSLLLILASLSLVACKPDQRVLHDACAFLNEYIYIADPLDTVKSKRVSAKQILIYKAWCK